MFRTLIQKLFPSRPRFELPQGMNFHLDNCVSVAELASTLQAIVAFLHAHTGTKTLRLTYDRVQIDGHPGFPGTISDFREVSRMIADADSLRECTLGEFAVRVGVVPEDYMWYLRFYVGEDREGDFDITVSEELAHSLRRVLRELHGEHLQEQEASAYYERITEHPRHWSEEDSAINDDAEGLLGAGEHVVPLSRVNGRYVPAVVGWAEASPSVRQTWLDDDRELWRQGVGLVCVGRLVVDINHRNGAGANAATELGVNHGLPVRTKSGGAHYHFRLPDGVEGHNVQAWRLGVNIISGPRAVIPVPGATCGYTAIGAHGWSELLTRSLPLAPDPLVEAVRQVGPQANERESFEPGSAALWEHIKRASSRRTRSKVRSRPYNTFQGDCQDVAEARPGEQRQILESRAYWSGVAVAKGWLDIDEVERELIAAGLKMVNGDALRPWREPELRQVVREGICTGWLSVPEEDRYHR